MRAASLTSRALAGSAGRIWTVVSARSAAVIWMLPAGTVRMAVTGAGVAKVYIAGSWAGWRVTELLMSPTMPARPVMTPPRRLHDH